MDSNNVVIVALDATRERNEHELKVTVNGIKMRGDILRGGDSLLVFGVLHTITNPMGYPMKVSTDSFFGISVRSLEEEVSRKVDMYESTLAQFAETCKEEKVSVHVKITAGTPSKLVILQEAIWRNAAWLILDRHLRKDLKFFLDQMPCKIALIQDSQTIDIRKPALTNMSPSKSVSEQKFIYSTERQVTATNHELPRISIASQYSDTQSGNFSRTNSKTQFDYKQNGRNFVFSSSEKPILCAVCGLKSVLYIKDSMIFRYSEIQTATSNFSEENLIGEGGFGHVYRGKLQNGQTIAAKVRKESSTQGFSEFYSEVHVLSFARHRNIVMLLGYCSKENHNILVYEYICNQALEWHLFKSENILEWHSRRAIAVGIAKGLRFLHEECRGGPIVHRDLRPSNILLTHDFIPMLADFGLAKCKSDNDMTQTRIIGTSGYMAPEYAEHGIVSVRTDVYAFGIVLFQLISGSRVLDESRQSQHLLQWAVPLVESLALHELIDPRLGDSYDMYELYHLAKAAFLCVQKNPEMRPSIGGVMPLLEIENKHIRDLSHQFVSHFTK